MSHSQCAAIFTYTTRFSIPRCWLDTFSDRQGIEWHNTCAWFIARDPTCAYIERNFLIMLFPLSGNGLRWNQQLFRCLSVIRIVKNGFKANCRYNESNYIDTRSNYFILQLDFGQPSPTGHSGRFILISGRSGELYNAIRINK